MIERDAGADTETRQYREGAAMVELQGTIEEARRVVGHVAMGDLLGASESPPGVPDAYPFNACRWRDAYPATYRAALEEVLAFVYHNDDLPPDMRTPDGAGDVDAGDVDAGDVDDIAPGPCCPVCLGAGVSMGALGRLEWFRCRFCGYEFNRGAGDGS